MLPLLAFALPVALAADSVTYSGTRGELDVRPPRLEASDVAVDGRLDEASWSSAARLTEFTQYWPNEGVPAAFATEVLVFYTADALYVGVRGHDPEPGAAIARLADRDQAMRTDDWFRIMLDTFDDQRQAYSLYINPLGVQSDGLWIEGIDRPGGGGGGGGGGNSLSRPSMDFSPDFVWESRGRITDYGWEAEVRIPFLSLRFRDLPEQDWGFNVVRGVKRTDYKSSWAPLSSDVPSTLAQIGKLRGLSGLRSGRLVEVTPVLTGRLTGSDASGTFVRDDFEPDFGVDGRVGLTRNLTLTGTYNPDFSQVEADANRLTVNERFALFFPEKRPFFLEGAEIFQMPRNLVHTRQIVDPVAGAKLSGKVGAWQVGWLGALDESPSADLAGASDALFNVARVRRDVGAGSTMGFVYTDRTRSGEDYNRVLGSDVRVLAGRHTLTAQLAGSWTAGAAAVEPGFRPLVGASVERTGRTFGWRVSFDDVDPSFRTYTGFINRVGDAQAFGEVRFQHYGAPGALLESATLQVRADNYFTHDGLWSGETPYEHEFELNPRLSFRGDRSLNVVLRNGYFRFRPEVYARYSVEAADGSVLPFDPPHSVRNILGVAAFPGGRVTNDLRVDGRLFVREVPIFAEASRGFEVQLGSDVTWRPTAGLALQLAHTYARIRRVDREPAAALEAPDRFATTNISRANVQYQFSRALMARAIVQYDLERRDALRDPRTGRPLLVGGTTSRPVEEGDFESQLLLQYEPSPGTIFYVGYSRLEHGDRTWDLARMQPREEGLFVKLSYLFRM